MQRTAVQDQGVTIVIVEAGLINLQHKVTQSRRLPITPIGRLPES